MPSGSDRCLSRVWADRVFLWMSDRAEEYDWELRLNHPDQSFIFRIGIQNNQCIDPLALGQIEISIAPRSGFYPFNQQFVTAGIADTADTKHQRRSKRVNAHQVSVSEYQTEGAAPSAEQHTSSSVGDATQCLRRFEHSSLSFGADVGSDFLIQNERDGGARHTGSLSNIVARYPPGRFHSPLVILPLSQAATPVLAHGPSARCETGPESTLHVGQ